MRDLRALGLSLKPIAHAAGAAIMRIYGTGFTVAEKEDSSPLTQADLESHSIIAKDLAQLTPDIPILSEEAAEVPWERRRGWGEAWVVDPLDGTREFIKRNGEFTVNIALICEHEPMLGLIAAPARGLLYWGAKGLGAFADHEGASRTAIRAAPAARPLRVVGSRSHAGSQTQAYLRRLPEHVWLGIGSSLKFCLIAEGAADLYPRFGPTSEWDTAAGQAILEAAGGEVRRLDGHRLRYNCRPSLLNGDFLAYGDPRALPQA